MKDMDVKDEAELDCILEQAELLEPETSPELLDITLQAEGLAPQEGGEGRLRNRGDSSQGSPFSLSLTKVWVKDINSLM